MTTIGADSIELRKAAEQHDPVRYASTALRILITLLRESSVGAAISFIRFVDVRTQDIPSPLVAQWSYYRGITHLRAADYQSASYYLMTALENAPMPTSPGTRGFHHAVHCALLLSDVMQLRFPELSSLDTPKGCLASMDSYVRATAAVNFLDSEWLQRELEAGRAEFERDGLADIVARLPQALAQLAQLREHRSGTVDEVVDYSARFDKITGETFQLIDEMVASMRYTLAADARPVRSPHGDSSEVSAELVSSEQFE